MSLVAEANSFATVEIQMDGIDSDKLEDGIVEALCMQLSKSNLAM